MGDKSKIMLVGGTGYIGKFMVEASARSGHPTFVLVREATLSNPSKSQLIESFKSLGVTFLRGDLYDHDSLVKAIKQVDVVISTLGHQQFPDQDKLLAAPTNVIISLSHSAFVKGDQTSFEIEPSFGMEASALYPDVKYTTVDEYLNRFV